MVRVRVRSFVRIVFILRAMMMSIEVAVLTSLAVMRIPIVSYKMNGTILSSELTSRFRVRIQSVHSVSTRQVSAYFMLLRKATAGGWPFEIHVVYLICFSRELHKKVSFHKFFFTR